MKEIIIQEIKDRAKPLQSNQDLHCLLEAVGNKPIVLLGEASHGTSEFYTWRAELTKRLILEKGFTSIAVEGDWPSCYEINRYIKGQAHQTADLASLLVESFDRWPTWMWANREILSLVQWLKEYNQDKPAENKVGFYGLDVYSLWESMEEVIKYLQDAGYREELEIARRVYSCFEAHGRDPQMYGFNSAFFSESCEDEVVQLLLNLQNKRNHTAQLTENNLSAEVNALVAVNAERYYRSMVRGGPESWNIRDHHMVEVINRILEHYGQQSKIIVWEHNTHIGDARATDMPAEGLVNVGQILREQKGWDGVYAIGFSSYSGSVIAGKAWGEPFEEIDVPPAQAGSWDAFLHEASAEDKILLFEQDEALFSKEFGHRAIGVVYQPQYEQYGNYVSTRLSQRYNAVIFLDHTHALHPLLPELELV